MTLTDRYLAAIRVNLPAKEADDITAELRDTLLSRQEELEAKLGRPMADADCEEMIRGFGHPLVVAGRYQRHQYLIGPTAFPFFVQNLKLVLAMVAAVVVTVGVFRAALSRDGIGPIIAQTWSGLWVALTLAVGVVTIVFAVLDR